MPEDEAEGEQGPIDWSTVDYSLMRSSYPEGGWDWPAIKEAGAGDLFCKYAAELFAKAGETNLTGSMIRSALDTLADGKTPTERDPEEVRMLNLFVSERHVLLNGARAARPVAAKVVDKIAGELPKGMPKKGWPAPATSEGALPVDPRRTMPPVTPLGRKPLPPRTSPAAPKAATEPSPSSLETAAGQAEELADRAAARLKEAGIAAEPDAEKRYEAAFLAAVKRVLRNRLVLTMDESFLDVIRAVDGDDLNRRDYRDIVLVVYAGQIRRKYPGFPEEDPPFGTISHPRTEPPDATRPEDLPPR